MKLFFTYLKLFLIVCCLYFKSSLAWAQQSTSLAISAIQTPDLTTCSTTPGTFILRIQNITAAPIASVTLRDSLPPGVAYIPGSVSGTGVTFGATITSNVVTFNVSSIPASSFVDIVFQAKASCSVSTVPTNIKNTYKASWSTFFTAPFTTANYGMLFPSISITPAQTGTYNANCLTPFVRDITICNGGFGALDTVVFSDVESNNSLVINGFSHGAATGLGTNNAKTVLTAADFATVGNGDGKLDQNECLVIHDTVNVVGSTSPITGTLTATWGCVGAICSNPNSNSFTTNTTINAASPLQPALTRTLLAVGDPDTPGQIYSRVNKYMEIVKNNSPVTAVNARVWPIVYGLKYIDTATIWVSKNGGAPYRPPMTHSANQIPYAWTFGTPADYGELLPGTPTFPNSNKWSNARLTLGDLQPGDSVVITFDVKTAGPLTRVGEVSRFDHCGSESFCGGCVRGMYGPSISGATDALISWQGCPSGSFTGCSQAFPQKIYNGLDTVQRVEYNPSFGYGHMLANFSSYDIFRDSTNLDGRKCAYFENDTVRVLMSVAAMDLPFYTDNSSFAIKIYTNGAVKWDGNLSRTFGRISTWSANPWFADYVLDNSATDSTITVYFRRNNCPIPDFRTKDVYNCYRGGRWELSIGFINQCPGSAQKRLYMTRIYDIDTTNAEPAIEAGRNTFPAAWTWNSKCAGPCAEGVSILNYGHSRTTFGAPDNDQNGLPDVNGTIDLSKVNTNLITWGDTLQLKYKMVVHTTNPAGLPSLYVTSSINYSDTNAANICNNRMLTKDAPQVVVKRPGIGTFSGTGSSIPISSSRFFITNISLQGTGGLNIPGLSTYIEGDTVELIQNLIYYKPHSGWGDITWSFLHVPAVAATVNPTTSQLIKCDSAVCNFHTIDQGMGFESTVQSAPSCSDSVVWRWNIVSQIAQSGCGTNYFPYESRYVYSPSLVKIYMPASSNFIFRSVRLWWTRVIFGSGNQCGFPINSQLLPPSSYTWSNDTLSLDLKQLAASYGFNYKDNNLYSKFYIEVTSKYNLTVAGCTKDHMRPSTVFPIIYNFETARPMLDSLNIYNGTRNNYESGAEPPTTLAWYGTNNNKAILYAGSSANVTSNKVIIPVRYTVTNTTGSYSGANCWMAIPSTTAVTVDSVKEKVSGVIVPMTPSGSNIYQLGNVGGNGATKDYDIYAHVNQCSGNISLDIYADRTPCTGYPASWASYGCQSSAKKSTYTLTTFTGELQMTDSLYSTIKDICTEDTVQFMVVNSQTQDANAVKVSFELPQGMSLVPGHTQLQYGNGSFVTTTDPLLNAGVYSWTMSTADTLRKISQTPANIMRLRVGVTTSCGYISGSVINSHINGNVACGPITSLYNTNPPPLDINGAPGLSYLTNPDLSVVQLGACGSGSDGTMKIVLKISGGSTLLGDSVKVKLPAGYNLTNYSSTTTGSHNSPVGNPTISTDATGKKIVGWQYPAAVTAGDSIVFFMQYNEVSGTNNCGVDPDRIATVNTFIGGNLFCARDNMMCIISTLNGSDTSIPLQTMRPSLSATVDTVRFSTGCTPQGNNCNPHSKLVMQGSVTNIGTAAIPVSTPLYMEVFVDMDNSGTVSPADSQYITWVSSSGLGIGQSISFNYFDTSSRGNCHPCLGKNLLIRFSNSPNTPIASSQCLCDTVAINTVPGYDILPLPLLITDFVVEQEKCNTAIVRWTTSNEPAGNLKYNIEVGADGRQYKTVATIKSKGQPTSIYEQVINLPEKDNYIRIAQTDDAGTYYTKVQRITRTCDLASGNSIEVYPNPHGAEHSILYVKLTEKQAGNVQINVLDAIGKQYMKASYEVVRGTKEYKLSGFGSLASGMYTLQVMHADGSIDYVKVVKD